MDYSLSSSSVNIYLQTTSAQIGGDAQGDQLSSVEAVIGSAYNDTLRGDYNVSNLLSGGDGDDFLHSAPGDTLDGGAGSDTAEVGSTQIPLFEVDLRTGASSGGETLISIENLSAFAYAYSNFVFRR
ncbi:MAG: hypothetical protein R3C55_08855 [Parvularculaceae bacterium]